MTRNYLEGGLKIAAALFFVAGAAKTGVAVANGADIIQANANKISATVALQKETPEQIAARTARIDKDSKDMSDNGIPGVVLFIAGGVALVAGRATSNSSNPYDRRANRRIS